jgi:hypothetical protein
MAYALALCIRGIKELWVQFPVLGAFYSTLTPLTMRG